MKKGCHITIASVVVFVAFLFPLEGNVQSDTTAKSYTSEKTVSRTSKRNPRRGSKSESPPVVFHTDVPEHTFDLILGRPTNNSITLSVLTYKDITGYVTYGTQQGFFSDKTAEQQFNKGIPVELALHPLLPNTRYYYRFQYKEPSAAGFQESEEYTFHTSRPPGSTFTFTVQADPHLDYNTVPELYARTLSNVRADHPDFHIDLGDTFMTDKYGKNYKGACDQYLAQRYYFGLVSHSAPLFLVLGNHDGESGRRFGGTDDNIAVWSTGMRTRYFPNPFPDNFYTGNQTEERYVGLPQNYYEWEWGNALFVVLDPYRYTTSRSKRGDNWGRTLGETQYRWFRKTLEESSAKFKFVFIHNLVGGADESMRGGIEAAKYFEWGGYNKDGVYEFDKRRPGWGAPIHRLLVRNNVTILFHGHDHFFAKQELDGVVYQLLPQPGHRGSAVVRNAAEYGYLNGTLLSSSGHVRVTVSKEAVRVDYVKALLPKDEQRGRQNGKVAYSYTIDQE